MISPTQARDAFVVPALTRLGLDSLDAEKLLMGTAAIESNFHLFIQRPGPARGMFQMEPPTFDDLMGRVLSTKAHRPLKAKVLSTSKNPIFLDITGNHLFAAAMARVKYYSIRAPIPSTLEQQAHYWWQYYNGESPHGLKPKDYIARWNHYCAPLYDGAAGANTKLPAGPQPFPTTILV